MVGMSKPSPSLAFGLYPFANKMEAWTFCLGMTRRGCDRCGLPSGRSTKRSCNTQVSPSSIIVSTSEGHLMRDGNIFNDSPQKPHRVSNAKIKIVWNPDYICRLQHKPACSRFSTHPQQGDVPSLMRCSRSVLSTPVRSISVHRSGSQRRTHTSE